MDLYAYVLCLPQCERLLRQAAPLTAVYRIAPQSYGPAHKLTDEHCKADTRDQAMHMLVRAVLKG